MNDWVVETPSFEEDLMNNRVVMLNQNGVNKVVEIIKEKDKEIERLNKELQDTKEHLEEYLHEQEEENKRLNKKIEQYENPEDMTLMFMWCDEKAKDEIKRLNNIINEFDKFLFGELQTYGGGGTAQEYYDKLQELKGEDKK